ncbi:hypothetical protein [Massilioclostridium coli]|nr:hypothetical protein [Massilioclostridium coli]
MALFGGDSFPVVIIYCDGTCSLQHGNKAIINRLFLKWADTA